MRMRIGIRGKLVFFAIDWCVAADVPKEFERAMRWVKSELTDKPIGDGKWLKAIVYVDLVG